MSERNSTPLEIIQASIDDLQSILDNLDTISSGETCALLASTAAMQIYVIGLLTGIPAHIEALQIGVILMKAEDDINAIKAMMN
jgi:hypothetical protein